MQEFLDIIDGREVAIVGNGFPERDYSTEIDSADLVVRFNHFYNYDTGKVGKRVDLIVQTFTSAWIKSENKHADIIRQQWARIFCGKKPEQYDPSLVAKYLGGICITDMTKNLEPYAMFTTGTAFLMWLASKPRNARFKIYGFPNGEQAEKYFSPNGDGKHYAPMKVLELQNRNAAIEILERQRIRRPREERKPMILIPVKKSTGVPQKNKSLLPYLLDKLQGIENPITVVGNDDELLCIAKSKGVNVFRTPETMPDEITATMRCWRDQTEYHGEIILIQCTAPHFKVEWLKRLAEGRRHAPISATCCKVHFKINALYGNSNGVWGQVVQAFGAPSVPRQRLPECVRLSGAAWAFHSDALSRESFYHAGTLHPVIVSEEESLDVDTKEDFEKALQVIERAQHL